MTINLDTGSIQQNTSPRPDLGVAIRAGILHETDDTSPAENIVYPSEHRQLLIVEPKTILVVTGYNLEDTTTVVFRKVLRSCGVPIHGTGGCCPNLTVSHSIRLHSTELPCWKLNRCLPIFIIKTPGSYEVDVLGDNINVVITAMAFPMQEVNDICQCDCSVPLSDGAAANNPLSTK